MNVMGIPDWIINLLVQEAEKEITPENVAKLEKFAAEFLCCHVKSLVAGTTTTLDDKALALLAKALNVDLSACPA